MTLAANGAITLVAAYEANRQSGDARSSGFTLGLTAQLGLDKGKPAAVAPTISVGVSSSNSHYAGTRITNQESVLRAGGTATLTTPGALGLDGALVSGDRLVVEAGSLAIASRQDSSRYASHARSASLGASVALGTGQVSLSGNVSSGRQQGDFASVAEQAGLYAGDGGFAIRVRGDTSLTGAVIASTADAAKNSLVTGTLHAADIQNRESWDAQQIALGGGIGGIGADRGGRATPQGATRLPGVRLGRLGTLTAAPPMAFGAGRAQSGTTQSAIAPATITISTSDPASTARVETLRRDTAGANAGALRQQFDEAKREEVANGFQAAQTLVVETSAFLSTQAAKADRWTKTHPGGDPKSNPYALWGAGGAGRLVLTAINGAAGADVTGSLGGLVQAAAVNVLQGLATTKVKALADALHSEGARAALQGLVGCAGSAAGGSGDCTSGALGAAASVVVNDLLVSLDPKKTDESRAVNAAGDPVPTYTQEEQQARGNFVATLVAAIAAAAGLDTQAGTLSAQIETQNNSVETARGPGGPVTICTLGEQTCAGAHPFGAWKNGTKAEQERWRAFAARSSGASDEEIVAAMRWYYAAVIANITDPKSPKPTEAAAVAHVRQESAKKAELDYLSAGDARKQAALSTLSTTELAELVAFKRNYEGLTESAKAIVRSDMASARTSNAPGRAFGTVLKALADPAILRALYFGQVQAHANGLDFAAGVSDAAKPAAQFLADLGTLGRVTDPATGQWNAYYQTPEGQAAYKAALNRLATRADAVGGAATAAGSALLQFLADIAPPRWAESSLYVPSQAEVDAYRARSSAALRAAGEGTNAMLSAVARQVVDFFDSCTLGGNSASRACGGATAILGANAVITLATDGIGKPALAEIGLGERGAGRAGSAAGAGVPPVRIFNGIELDPRLPPPEAGYDYVPKLVDSSKSNLANSHLNGFKAELELANTIAALPNQQVISYGAKIGTQGADVISVDVTTGMVTLWDSKWRSASGMIKSSDTFTPGSNALARAVRDAQEKIERSSLPNNIKEVASKNLLERNLITNTPGSGSLRNSVSVRLCRGRPCVPGEI
ncbi:hemagglutinin repeat-containing protein [Sphingomonas morindae]|uniref:Hemagglutinin repeat-containing protein n=1 Tax=Sphingomonas morindae TaxID=1541170 RepID=A0ABY4XC74_9SPHN|nr:hemagglutinin repeat-containing protein [Sphingomonas morindae]USI74474.1 hemagglutinin repeat-containing protein [Sphingomonas morindae]